MAGRDVAAGGDVAADAIEAGQDTGSDRDTGGDAREAGRDAGRSDLASGPDAASDAATAVDAGAFLVRGQSRKWHITSTVTVDNQNATLTRLVVILPSPQTNVYQDVENLAPGAGTQLGIPGTDDFYLRFFPSVGLPSPRSSASYAIAYDVTLYELSVDFSKVTTIPPYDTSAPDYARYTGPRGVYVDPDNATIGMIADSLASGNPDVLTYARAAYEHVASHYQYLNPNTGLHPLSEILAAGGGDCGNLASIYVSLLRHRGIPARHLVAVRPDGSYHVWADFLVAGYGWVPVDVTYKHDDPAGDYFGKVALGGNGIIMDKQVWLTLDVGDGTTEVALLQNYAWWFWSNTPSPTVTTSYALMSAAR
ncbi:MAG: transglutaminase domain-containing protein [Deltaproteobacteria bacterium]|nr:transglutaminase domain-containing protein [Deltaproteobacteria bacterium]